MAAARRYVVQVHVRGQWTVIARMDDLALAERAVEAIKAGGRSRVRVVDRDTGRVL